jgi:hypothetical protein
MRYKAIFAAGFAAGFVAGARAGRGAYDKIAGAAQTVAGNPKVQQATSAAQAKATDLAKSAAAKAPDYAKSAAASAAKTAQAQVSQVPKYVASAKEAATSAKEAAASKLPPRFGGTAGTDSESEPVAGSPVSDGAVTDGLGDVGPDGHLVYPADPAAPSVNGIHYSQQDLP